MFFGFEADLVHRGGVGLVEAAEGVVWLAWAGDSDDVIDHHLQLVSRKGALREDEVSEDYFMCSGETVAGLFV